MEQRRRADDAARQLRLTSPTNKVSLLSASAPRAQGPPPRTPASLAELDARAREVRTELRFSPAVPIAHWMRCADTLKRQVDQHHIARDLEMQYLCILSELIPLEHPGWHRLDEPTRALCTSNAAFIHHLVRLTRDALRGRGEPAAPHAPLSPSAHASTPTRSSLRHSARTRSAHTSPKRVSFADVPDHLGAPAAGPAAAQAPLLAAASTPTRSRWTFRGLLPWQRPSAPPRAGEGAAQAAQAAPATPATQAEQAGQAGQAEQPTQATEAEQPASPAPRKPGLRRRVSSRLFLTADAPVSLVAHGQRM